MSTYRRFAEVAVAATAAEGGLTAEPAWPGIHRAPKGVVLDTDAAIAANGREIYLQAGRSHAMPPGNVTEIEPGERKAIVDWYRAAVQG